jgi:hypothetical protein
MIDGRVNIDGLPPLQLIPTMSSCLQEWVTPPDVGGWEDIELNTVTVSLQTFECEWLLGLIYYFILVLLSLSFKVLSDLY